ncbi:hypothetical protein [Undibacterium terreum]|uniref:hypothetical protein n=1 Tax=Undibacterium terreum TaxID=1224302 RepID=UPI0016651376|nr:hypothetical protein [Undibacterium terreum]
MKKVALSFLLPAFALTPIVGQTETIYDACKTIITDGLREYSIQTSSSEYLNSVHDNYCEASGSAKSSKFGLGLDAVVDAIPIKFTGSYGSSQEAMKNFCKNYDSSTVALSDQSAVKVTTVSRAYQSFDQCMALAAQNVVLRHQVVSAQSFNFQVAPGFNRPVTINGIQVEGAVQCYGQTPKSATAVKFDKNTKVTLANNDTVSLGCTRTGTKDAKGNTIYDTATVTLFTNIVPNGNYSVYIPKQTTVATDDAADIATRLAILESSLTTTSSNVSRTNSRLDKFRFNIQYTDRAPFPLPSPPGCPAGFLDTGGITVYSVEGSSHGVGQYGRLCYTVDQ